MGDGNSNIRTGRNSRPGRTRGTIGYSTRLSLAASLLGIFTIAPAPAQTGSLVGVVLDLQTKRPLEFVNVMVVGTTLGAATDAQGHYEIGDVPVGTYQLRFSMIGFKEKVVSNVQIPRARTVTNVLLEETAIQTEEVIIIPKSDRYDASGISARLGREMVASAPGSAQDIFWVVQTLPGIASDGDNSKLYVRGGSSGENLVLYDGATIRNPFHFDMMGGGYWSVFNSRLVEKVEFYAGGFPARYGDRLSSVLVIENRAGSIEQLKGEASVSMSDVSGTIEALLTFANATALLSARRSYFDAFLKYTDLAGEYSVLPYFFDMNSKLDFNLSPEHKLTISGLYTREQMYGYFDRPNYTGDFSWQNKASVVTGRLRSLVSEFFLSDLIVSWTKSNSASVQPSNGLESYDIEEVTMKQDFTLIFPSHEFHVGGWLTHEREEVLIYLPMAIAPNFDELNLRGSGTSVKPSFYAEDKWMFSSKLAASIGLRYDYVARSKENSLAPRINLSYAWNDHMSLSADYGWYYQSPRPFELGMSPNLRSKRAESFGVGMKHEIDDVIVASIELYSKNLSQLVTIDSLWNLSDDGYGYSRGVELYVHVKSEQGLFGWLSYTYSASKREEGTNKELHFFDYDRPHLVSAVANYRFAEHWQVGGRFRYGSGRPYTPAASAWYDPNSGRWYPVPGIHNSDRYPAYSRLDIRLTRHFQFESFDMDLYLELLNVYNRKNIVHYMWDETYSSKDELTIFPFLPVIGVAARF